MPQPCPLQDLSQLWPGGGLGYEALSHHFSQKPTAWPHWGLTARVFLGVSVCMETSIFSEHLRLGFLGLSSKEGPTLIPCSLPAGQ